MTISQDQARKRFVTLPPSLQDAIFSVQNAEIIATTIEDSDLNDDQASMLPEVVGWVLLGFLKPDDFIETLTKQMGLDMATATAIQKNLNDKIFTLLRPQIDAAQQQSAVVKDINAPKIIATTTPSVGIPTPPIPPQSLSGMGWSKMKPLGPAIVSSVPPPAPLNTILNSIPKPPSPPKSSMGEFERIKSSITPPVPSVPTHIPAPIMLQQEIPVANATQKNADFHIAKSSESAQMEFSKAKEQIKVMPAVIEFNRNAPANTKTSTVPLPLSAPNHAGAINYTEFKSSLASIPIMDSGARKVTEITSAVPVPTPATPTISPKPPTPPMPPVINKTSIQTPPQPLAQKVIVQNFLEKPLK